MVVFKYSGPPRTQLQFVIDSYTEMGY